jgi:hypothetical protein
LKLGRERVARRQGRPKLLVKGVLLEKRSELDNPVDVPDRDVLEGKRPVSVVVVVTGQADLLEVVGAVDAVGGRADLLDGGEQHGDENADDGDHHQKLNESERRRLVSRF